LTLNSSDMFRCNHTIIRESIIRAFRIVSKTIHLCISWWIKKGCTVCMWKNLQSYLQFICVWFTNYVNCLTIHDAEVGMVEWGGGVDVDSFVANLFVLENVSWNWISITRYVVTAPTIWKIPHYNNEMSILKYEMSHAQTHDEFHISRACKYETVNSRSQSMKQYSRSVFPKPFFLSSNPLWLLKIITDPHILAHVNLVGLDDRYPKLKIFISDLTLDS
jgi:hypothetical protein